MAELTTVPVQQLIGGKEDGKLLRGTMWEVDGAARPDCARRTSSSSRPEGSGCHPRASRVRALDADWSMAKIGPNGPKF
ncbi:hypothetical protein [Streptomyces sp. NPDC050535]|uniref:hypothetical protein n=1 Tax=Streptomyces sp. NPDC050535 TaxID=3365626 RepID=UPI0037AADFE5